MIDEKAVVLVPFPQTETGSPGKVRPAVVIRRLPGAYDDWLICMLSLRVDQSLDGFDEMISKEDGDFATSGLKISSVLRIARLAVCHDTMMLGEIGRIADNRLRRVRNRLCDWLSSKPA
jgi:mRNA interferase MazF